MLFVRNGIDTYTKLCLNRGLANNSTTFMDGSLRNHTVTAYGDSKWSNGSQKFGQNTMYFDGTGDYLSIPDNDNFELGSGKFTIDAWVNLSSIGTSGIKTIFAKWSVASASYFFVIWNNIGTYYLIFRWSTDGNATPVTQLSGLITINENEWHHCAVCKSSATSTKLYYDGNYIGGTTTEFSTYPNSTLVTIGATLNDTVPVSTLNGYISQLRFSKNIARWSSNFTPPYNHYA